MADSSAMHIIWMMLVTHHPAQFVGSVYLSVLQMSAYLLLPPLQCRHSKHQWEEQSIETGPGLGNGYLGGWRHYGERRTFKEMKKVSHFDLFLSVSTSRTQDIYTLPPVDRGNHSRSSPHRLRYQSTQIVFHSFRLSRQHLHFNYIPFASGFTSLCDQY